MFGLFKKKKKEYKRPSYYPTMRIKFIKRIKDGFESVEVLDVNYCCETIKIYSKFTEYADVYEYFYFSRWGRFLTNPSVPGGRHNVNYCPFCGAKIEIECIKTLKYTKVGCDELVEPEKLIPATTKKVCKYEWQEVK